LYNIVSGHARGPFVIKMIMTIDRKRLLYYADVFHS